MIEAQNHAAGIWHCYVRPDRDTGLFVGHCLNLHVKVAGKDPAQAWANLRKVVKAHYEYCFAADPEGLNITAPASDWVRFSTAFEKALRDNPTSIRVEHIVFKLRLPKVPEQTIPLSCQGVEIAQPACATA